jgi:RNA polymerase sigma-70 factor (ECF subfamily)
MATTLKTLGLDFAETKSEKTFNDLYMRIKPGLLNYINQIVKDRDAAEDLFSMTMSIVYNKIDQYKPEYHISTWIYRIAYHEAIMFLRRKKRDATTTFSVFDSYYDSERGSEKLMYNNMNSDELYDEDFVTKEEKEEQLQQVENAIFEAIENLDPLYSNIIKDRLINNMKYNDMATKYDLPLHTIKNRIARGKRILQSGLKEYRNI